MTAQQMPEITAYCGIRIIIFFAGFNTCVEEGVSQGAS
jgi:hypothetical protein